MPKKEKEKENLEIKKLIGFPQRIGWNLDKKSLFIMMAIVLTNAYRIIASLDSDDFSVHIVVSLSFPAVKISPSAGQEINCIV